MKVVIIGATAAGTTCAAKLHRLMPEADIVLLEKGSVSSFGSCGLPFFVGGFFHDENEMIARTPEQFLKSGINIKMRHEVTALESAERKILGKDLETGAVFEEKYDKLVIACGATAVLPPIVHHKPSNAFLLRTLEDGRALKAALEKPQVKRVAIIGAGFIGVELCESVLNLGLEADLIEMKERVMADAFDEELSWMMAEELEEKGVRLHLGQVVTELVHDPIRQVKTSKELIDTDLVIFSAGIRPATGFLKNSALELNERGAIVTDKLGQTNLPDVFAAGDCALVPHVLLGKQVYSPLATTANKFGRAIAEVIATGKTEFKGVLGASSVKVLDLEAARVGLGEQEALDAGFEACSVVVNDKDHASYYPGREDIRVKLIYNKPDKRLLGGQIAGKHGASLRVHALSAAIAAGMAADDLAYLDLAYSPPFARTWDVLNVAAGVAK